MLVQMAMLALATWLAATLSGVAGFGGALLLLPLFIAIFGPQRAIPILTVVQLAGNLSRAGLGWKRIAWKPVGLFLVGALPAAGMGSLLLVSLDRGLIEACIGLILLLLILARRWGLIPESIRPAWLVPGGALTGGLSGLAGSAGPLGAAFFLGLNLAPLAYISSEAMTAIAMHATKAVVYQRFNLMDWFDWWLGGLFGAVAALGSWSGKRLASRLPADRFRFLVEALIFISGCYMVFRGLLA